MNVKSRARRILAKGGHLVNYRHIEGSTLADAQLLSKVPLALEEELLGVYDNPEDSIVREILMTTLGLYFLNGRDDHVERIPYMAIKSVRGPDVSPAPEPNIVLELVSGGMRSIPICGHRGRFQDVFEFLRFLMRVVADTCGGSAG